MAPGLGHTIRPVAAHVEAGQGHTRMDPQEQIRLLQIELAKVRQEASTLRRRLGKNGYHARRIERAAEDALLLAVIRLAEVLPSRRLASSLGIPEGRYGHALALLRLARIVTRQRHWATTDIATIESRIVAPADRLWKTPKPFFASRSTPCLVAKIGKLNTVQSYNRVRMDVEKRVDTEFKYKPPHHIEAHCRVRIYEGEDRTVVMISENSDNPGMSVTKASEDIATRIVQVSTLTRIAPAG